MAAMLPSARLKTNQDTYYIPDLKGGIYFRNHKHSFRMQGSNVYQWMEKLIPLFDGTRTMQQITEGLPAAYQQRIYEFSSILLDEGFVRDISKDRPHTLDESIVKHFQVQIDYLDHQIGSGAYHFENYRRANLLVIGHGSFLLSLLSSLLESGLQKIALFITDKSKTNLDRIWQLETEARKIDPAVKINDITPCEIQPWADILSPYKSILFVGEVANVEETIRLSSLCQQENKYFIPAVIDQNTGIVGPVADWESAWRRVKKTDNTAATETNQTALAILANVLSFRWFQLINQIITPDTKQVFVLHMKTLEGKWHSFYSHPLTKEIENSNTSVTVSASSHQTTDIHPIFARITSPQTGVFRAWGPKDLIQLPLSQCQVEIADPLGEKNVPPIVCSALTHQEARREAGLCGLEAYAARLFQARTNDSAFGAGASRQEAICRAFLRYLEMDCKTEPSHPHKIQLEEPFLIECLRTFGAEPTLCVEKHRYGFPIGWVKINDMWFHGTGLSVHSAVRAALLKALQFLQNNSISTEHLSVSSTICQALDSIDACLTFIHQQLKTHQKQLKITDMKLEDIISDHFFIVHVSIEEEKA